MQIDDDVIVTLSNSKVEGNILKLPFGLGRDLYVRTNKVLDEMGGKWNRGKKGHLFDFDPTETLEGVIQFGVIGTQAEFGYFPTPKEEAKNVVGEADIEPDHVVLEPSAGQGAIADEVMAECVCVELQEKNAHILECKGYEVFRGDFLDMMPKDLGGRLFDRIVMNPPFAKRADIAHVTHAYEHFLKPGGRLVAIVSAGVTFRDDRKGEAFRALVRSAGGTMTTLDKGTFKESGTMVNTVRVIMDKSDPFEDW